MSWRNKSNHELTHDKVGIKLRVSENNSQIGDLKERIQLFPSKRELYLTRIAECKSTLKKLNDQLNQIEELLTKIN